MFLPSEPRQTAPREIIEEAPVELAHFHFAWHIPDVRHPDMPALDILAALLGHGRSSRLFREVREKKGLVTAADAWTYTPGDQGLFGMSAVVDAPKFIPARDALLAEVQRAQTKPVPAAELAKVVKQFIAGALSIRKTMQGQAQDLGGKLAGRQRPQFLRTLPRRRQARHPRRPATRRAPILDSVRPHPLRPPARRRRARSPPGPSPPFPNIPSKKSSSPTACASSSRKITACPSWKSAPSSRAACWPKRWKITA